ncbi:MAG: formylglycine-generating enzyme family protein, partial [Candidatus Poribacteria bacterium]|nr:formylglycine-generating enzyme family protein [Candidatus Poribacteria bacterium]
MTQKGIVCLLTFTILWVCGIQHIPSAGDIPDGMVLIPAGEFEMGSHTGKNNERPVHTVYVDAFYMDVYEVTNTQYKAFVDANPEWQKENIAEAFHDGVYLRLWNGNAYPDGKADHPVIYVSWYAAMAYAQWAGKRLPTEAEWEKAARGGLVEKMYPSGDTIDATRANYARHFNAPIAVGRYPPNGYGLYDMAGNVSEWCLDEYDPDFYATSAPKNPFSNGTREEVIKSFKVIKKKNRVLRGGCWTD